MRLESARALLVAALVLRPPAAGASGAAAVTLRPAAGPALAAATGTAGVTLAASLGESASARITAALLDSTAALVGLPDGDRGQRSRCGLAFDARQLRANQWTMQPDFFGSVRASV